MLKSWRRLYQLLRWRHTILGNYPLEVHVELTTRCNKACPACPRAELKLEPKDMAWPDYLYMIEKLKVKEFKFSKLVFGGLGEPGLYPHFSEALKYAQENLDAEVCSYTNGTALVNHSDAVLKYCDRVFFSLNESENVHIDIQKKKAVYESKHGNLQNWSLGKPQPKHYPCAKPFVQFYIGLNLDVYACCMFKLVECLDHNQSMLHIGNLRTDTVNVVFWQAWKLQEQLKRGNPPARCGSCDYWRREANVWVKHGGRWR